MIDTDYAPRQRVLDALDHREPDRIPFDLGGSPTKTGFTLQAYDRFVELMGLDEEPDGAMHNSYVQIAGFKQIPENVLRHLGVDTRGTILCLPTEPEPRIEFEDGAMIVHDE